MAWARLFSQQSCYLFQGTLHPNIHSYGTLVVARGWLEGFGYSIQSIHLTFTFILFIYLWFSFFSFNCYIGLRILREYLKLFLCITEHSDNWQLHEPLHLAWTIISPLSFFHYIFYVEPWICLFLSVFANFDVKEETSSVSCALIMKLKIPETQFWGEETKGFWVSMQTDLTISISWWQYMPRTVTNLCQYMPS